LRSQLFFIYNKKKQLRRPSGRYHAGQKYVHARSRTKIYKPPCQQQPYHALVRTCTPSSFNIILFSSNSQWWIERS